MPSDPLALRHQRLVARSGQLRQEWVRQVQVLQQPLSLADRALTGLNWLARHPLWPLGTVLVVLVLRPRRALRWGGRVWWAWTTLRRTLR